MKRFPIFSSTSQNSEKIHKTFGEILRNFITTKCQKNISTRFRIALVKIFFKTPQKLSLIFSFWNLKINSENMDIKSLKNRRKYDN